MGKKTRKTRWRTLSIADDGSDSAESSTVKAQRSPKPFQQKSLYNKFTYSSQSTPRRRYQYDGVKSTRSSSTASENKITFNEDEYTKITTPRQDVLFKKGYLNKPRNYQTQTSTGTSTTSTGNSTGNGTPDYQSTDLEYESQFVLPNGFVDQNGIYYLNGYDSYPLMFYNMPTYYPDYATHKMKVQSSDSLTESVSPDNDEATSQEQSGAETSTNLSDYSGHQGVYNFMYPGYYINSFDPCHEILSGNCHADQLRRIKKRKRIKSSVSHITQDSTECSDGESEDYEEKEDVFDCKEASTELSAEENLTTKNSSEEKQTHICERDPIADVTLNDKPNTNDYTSQNSIQSSVSDIQTEITDNPALSDAESFQYASDDLKTLESSKQLKYDLKPDAKEFVPKAYNHSDIPFSSVHFIKVSPNFIHLPIVPLNSQNFNHSLIPSGIPVNFIPPDPKMFMNFLQSPPVTKKVETEKDPLVTDQLIIPKDCDNSNTATNIQYTKTEDIIDKKITNNNPIDIATIVSKLEEAAKQQEEKESNKKSFKKNDKFNNVMNCKQNVSDNSQNSPQVEQSCKNSPQKVIEFNEKISNDAVGLLKNKLYKTPVSSKLSDKIQSNIDRQHVRYIRKTSDKFKKDWKPAYPNNFNKRYSNQENNVASQTKVIQLRDKLSYKNEEIIRTKQGNDSLLEGVNITQVNAATLVHQNYDSRKIKISMNKIKPHETNSDVKFSSSINKPINKWISVCNRKRKRNKGVEEKDLCEKEQDYVQDDISDTTDINLVVEISTPDVEMNSNCKNAEVRHDEISNLTSQVENDQLDSNDCLHLEINHVNTEKESIEENESDEVPQKLEFELISSVQILAESLCSEDDTKVNIVDNKCNKKNAKTNVTKRKHKNVTKRVIITDIDLSENPKEIKSSTENITMEIEKPTSEEMEDKDAQEILLKSEVKTFIPEIEEQYCSPESSINEEDKKKSKKKKKKSTKVATSNVSNDNLPITYSTPDVSEDSFEFLDSAFARELEEKTNDEIYRELDKVIQRGMYNNLEEKIKVLNINEGDDFFKSMFSKVSFKEANPSFIKPPNFNELLQTTQSYGKPNLVSEEISFQNNNVNTLLNDLDLPTQDDFFLENPAFMEVLEDQTDKKILTKQHTNTNIKEEVKVEIVEDPKTLYPITEAVKEWMCRTRETTPDVEILKSPSTIYKEFCGSASDCESETELDGIKNLSDVEMNREDDEITVFSAVRRESIVSDLMDYWEDEVKENDDKLNCAGKCEDSREDKETIEVYESEYGNNQFFLKLNKDLYANTNNVNNSKNSGLPHKAVCCNIM